jgi:hypothetical protein
MAGVTVAFDTLKAATRLQEEAGFDETKARVLVSTFAEGMVENLATKDDIAGLRREFGGLRRELTTLATKEELATLATKEELATLRGEMQQMDANLRGEMKQMDASLRGEMKQMDASLRGEMKQMDASLRGEISKVQERLTVRLGGAIAAAVAILVAVDKLL